MTRLAGLTALITGGGTGMGRAIAGAFAREGAKVVVAARRVEKLQEVVREIEAAGGEGLAVACDVTRGTDAESKRLDALARRMLSTSARVTPYSPAPRR